MEANAGTDELNDVHTENKAANAIGVVQLRTNMCDYVRRVAAGESFTVLRRGRPVAVIDWGEERGPMLQQSSIRLGRFDSGVPVDLIHLRDCASRYLDRVAAGEKFVVIYRGNRVARIVAATNHRTATTPKRRCSTWLSPKV